MKHTHTPQGVCSRRIEFDIEAGRITALSFRDGCDGNAKGLAALAVGMSAEEAMTRLAGIRCGRRSTSCPDQFAKALRIALEKEKART